MLFGRIFKSLAKNIPLFGCIQQYFTKTYQIIFKFLIFLDVTHLKILIGPHNVIYWTQSIGNFMHAQFTRKCWTYFHRKFLTRPIHQKTSTFWNASSLQTTIYLLTILSYIALNTFTLSFISGYFSFISGRIISIHPRISSICFFKSISKTQSPKSKPS